MTGAKIGVAVNETAVSLLHFHWLSNSNHTFLLTFWMTFLILVLQKEEKKPMKN